MADKDPVPAKNVGSAFDLLSKSAEIVKKHWKLFAFVNLIAIIDALILAARFGSKDRFDGSNLGAFGGPQFTNSLSLSFAVFLLIILISIFFYAMATKLQVETAQQRSLTFSELVKSGTRYWLRIFGLTIAQIFIVVIGLLLLIVPGIIAIGRIALAPYIMVDKDSSIREALKRSNHMGKERPGAIWSGIGVTVLVGLLTIFLYFIPFIGPLMGVALEIALSLVLVLRYIQLKGLARA